MVNFKRKTIKMIIEKKIKPLKDKIKSYKKKGLSIGLVATMGNLHEGHLNLVKASTKENDITIVTQFINPTQFGPKEDFKTYPKTLKEDIKKLTPLKK